MLKALKKAIEYLLIFSLGCFLYMTLEMVYRNFTTYSMGLLGGMSLILVGFLNDCSFGEKMPIWLQMILGGLIITSLELITGLILNKDFSIWDYRDLALNFKGQICLAFSFIWVFLSLICILLQDYLNQTFFGKPQTHYYLGFRGKLKIF